MFDFTNYIDLDAFCMIDYLDGLQEKDEARGGTDPGEYVAVNMSLCMAAG